MNNYNYSFENTGDIGNIVDIKNIIKVTLTLLVLLLLLRTLWSIFNTIIFLVIVYFFMEIIVPGSGVEICDIVYNIYYSIYSFIYTVYYSDPDNLSEIINGVIF